MQLALFPRTKQTLHLTMATIFGAVAGNEIIALCYLTLETYRGHEFLSYQSANNACTHDLHVPAEVRLFETCSRKLVGFNTTYSKICFHILVIINFCEIYFT